MDQSTTGPDAPDVEWVPPGPGHWAIDRSHMPPGATPITQYLIEHSAAVAFRRAFAANGVPLDTMDMRFVNGQMYTRLRPLIRPDKPSSTLPPAMLLKLAVRVHPEMRRRNRLAEATSLSKPWNDVIHEWHHGGKSAIEAANAALQAVDRHRLDDVDLIAHVNDTIDHCRAQFEHHFWLHSFDLGPLGTFIHQAIEWGVDATTALSLMEGASPSTSEPVRLLQRIRQLIERAGRTPSTLDEARAISAEVGQAIDDYLRRRGYVLFSRYDLDGVTLGERPDLVLASILNAQWRDTSAEVAARTGRVRDALAAEQRTEFDELLSEARAAMDLRDDNGPTTAEWPLGLVRAALLSLGQRLVAKGVLDDAELVFELRRDEVGIELLAGAPAAATLRVRATQRARMKAIDAPAELGPSEPTPPPDVLPHHLARVVGMVQTVVQFMGMTGAADSDPLSGTGIGTQIVRGTARLATNPEDALDVLEPGDILVVAGTTPAYNLVLSIAGGVVTADGGPMSHAAVIARELGIPAVVGARGALTDIPEGALVEVDAAAGVVRIIAAAVTARA